MLNKEERKMKGKGKEMDRKKILLVMIVGTHTLTSKMKIEKYGRKRKLT